MKDYIIKKEIPTEAYFKVEICADIGDADEVQDSQTYSISNFDENVVAELIRLNSHIEEIEYGELDFNNEWLPIPWDAHTIISVEVKFYDIDGFVYSVDY